MRRDREKSAERWQILDSTKTTDNNQNEYRGLARASWISGSHHLSHVVLEGIFLAYIFLPIREILKGNKDDAFILILSRPGDVSKYTSIHSGLLLLYVNQVMRR